MTDLHLSFVTIAFFFLICALAASAQARRVTAGFWFWLCIFNVLIILGECA